MSERKKFILDTSVLLYDKKSIHSFPGNDIIIPISVLDELDRFKDREGVIGENARYVNRFLDEIRKKEGFHLWSGVKIEDDQTIRVYLESDVDQIQGLDYTSVDNQIICLAKKITNESSCPVILVTKDINFRVKCDALQISAEDYYKDNVDKETSFYTGYQEIVVEPGLIDDFYEFKELSHLDIDKKLKPNEFVIFSEEGNLQKSAMGFVEKNKISLLTDKSVSLKNVNHIKPKNKEQLFALKLLLDKNIPLVTISGIAGSGKTFLTLMAGMSGLNSKNFSKIVITRPIQTVGKDLGYLPGDLDDKMSVWIKPIVDNFKEGLKDDKGDYFELMKSKGDIEIAPLPYIRGRTFSNSFIIVDEAQNATIHELKTLITRVGEGSKIVLLGDTDQIDTPYIDKLSNGLSIVIDKFKKSDLSGHITLAKGTRSNLATFASKIL